MHKMPVLWTDYVKFLSEQPQHVTRVRRAFDRALQSLPLTQHHVIWPLYLAFARASQVLPTCVCVYRRYLQAFPSGREEYVSYLLSIGKFSDGNAFPVYWYLMVVGTEHWDEAAFQLAAMVNDPKFQSPSGINLAALKLK
jgi:pre-mRNA-splicing factor SYF1